MPARHLTGTIAFSILSLLGGLSGTPGARTCAAPPDPFAHLDWLARQQNPDGSWGDARTEPGERVRLTALALLNFLGGEYTHRSRVQPGDICFGRAIRKGLDYLMEPPDAAAPSDGHAEAGAWPSALVMTEVYRQARSALFWCPAQRALERLARTGSRDAATTAGCALVLASARRGELPVPDALVQKTEQSIQALLAQDQRAPLPAAEAAALMVAVLAWRPELLQPRYAEWDRRIEEVLKKSEDDFPLQFWGFAAVARRGRGTVHHPVLNGLLAEWIPDRQRKNAHPLLNGSWDPGSTLSPPARAVKRDPPPLQSARIRDLVSRLDDDRWDTRARAEKEIVELGAVTYPFLLARLDGEPSEGSLRAARLLEPVAFLDAPTPRIATTCERGLLFELYCSVYPPYAFMFDACCLIDPQARPDHSCLRHSRNPLPHDNFLKIRPFELRD